MFDRHQAEITVMQVRGHSLPVHQSMSVSWAFTLSHFISQIRLRDFFRLLAIGMCHFLPVHHFGMAFLAGSKVKIQQYLFIDASGWVINDVSFGFMGGFGSCNIKPPHPNDPVGIDLLQLPSRQLTCASTQGEKK